MQVEKIYKSILSITHPTKAEYFLLEYSIENKIVYFGKDKDNNIIYALPSAFPKAAATCQRTKELIFNFNSECTIYTPQKQENKVMHILSCTSRNTEEILAFIRITFSFTDSIETQDPNALYNLFSSITNLFKTDKKSTLKELQGFYTELYTILFLHNQGLDVSTIWQEKEKMNFDFSISKAKKMEVKSTLKPNRIHHFRHEQLLSYLYDIKVASYLLREDNNGLSLYNLINTIREIAKNNFNMLIYIENFIKGNSREELASIKFDKNYTDANLKFFDAKNIRKFESQQPEGVSKTEYDSDLTAIPSLSYEEMFKWISEK